MTMNQCIHYALSRPAVAVVLAGAHSEEQLRQSLAPMRKQLMRRRTMLWSLPPSLKSAGTAIVCIAATVPLVPRRLMWRMSQSF